MSSTLLAGTRENRDQARTFLSRIDARGGTELLAGVIAATSVLGGPGDLMIVTDGQVSGTEQILERAKSLGVRLSCLGIGSASQDRFLSLLARSTGGVSRFLTPRERVDLAAVDLFASLARPVAKGLTAGPGVQPAAPEAVYAGTPLLLFGEIQEDSGLEIAWNNGRTSIPISGGDAKTGEAVRLLRGSRLITDLESGYTGGLGAPLARRQENRVASRLAELSRTYNLASREMSLVAVVSRKGDEAGELPETQVVPLGMPQQVEFSSYFTTMAGRSKLYSANATPVRLQINDDMDEGLADFGDAGMFQQWFGHARADQPAAAPPESAQADHTAIRELMSVASELEPDAGFRGKNVSDRAGRTAAILLAFVAAGHSENEGAFRLHVHRLMAFLRSLTGLSATESEVIRAVLAAASAETAWEGDWLTVARSRWGVWRALRRAAAAHGQTSHK